MRYRTQAINPDGGDGTAFVPDGLTVTVSSPLTPDRDPSGSNPEQLLALAWATCLNATARVIVAGERRTTVRVEVELHDADVGGYEFRVDAYLSVEGASPQEAEQVLAAAHDRCPVSRLLRDAATARVHTEAYAVS